MTGATHFIEVYNDKKGRYYTSSNPYPLEMLISCLSNTLYSGCKTSFIIYIKQK